MTDLARLQALFDENLHLGYQLQAGEEGAATLTVQPDNERVLGPAGSQLVYTFQDGQLINLEILVAAG